MGVRRRAPEQLADTRTGRGRGIVVSRRPLDWILPPLPAEVTDPLTDPVQARFQPAAVRHATNAWAAWWSSAPSEAVDLGSDLEAINWWIVCVFLRRVYLRIVREQPLVKGSTGQPVNNPLVYQIRGLTADIDAAAAHFGMHTVARFRLHFEARGQRRHDEDDGDGEDTPEIIDHEPTMVRAYRAPR